MKIEYIIDESEKKIQWKWKYPMKVKDQIHWNKQDFRRQSRPQSLSADMNASEMMFVISVVE